jgi:hypothetical protein
MPKKKKKAFRASKAVKSAARNVIGSPRPTRRQTSKKEKTVEKHKPTFGNLLTRDD